MRKKLLAAGAVVAFAVFGVITFGVGASTPETSSLTVPDTAGQSASVSWTGTIPVGTNPTSDCNNTVSALQDEHVVDVSIPSSGYDQVTATFSFKITWTPSSGGGTTSDEILTVNAPGEADQADTQGSEIDSSDGSDTTETVIAHNLGNGDYAVLACGFVNSAPQAYTGTLTVETTAKSAEASLPSVDAQGLAFSAAVAADPQRDEAEPLIEIARDGHIYTCGPTGFSNGADYAQVSTDGGDQFHLLGTPPRGQQGIGGGGDCGLATGVTPNASGSYQYAYAGLGALSGFTTATSGDNGHSIASGGLDTTGGVTNNGVLADRQWLTFTDSQTALMAWNQQEPRNTVVLKSTDGGLNYDFLNGSIAAPNPEFPGPMRYITSAHIVYMPWTKGEEVNLAISRDGGTTWTNCLVAKGDTVKGGTAGFAAADNDQAGNVYVVWADSDRYHTWLSTLSAASLAGCNEPVATVAADKAHGNQPTVDPGWSAPVQVDRDAVRTTVFPWVAAGGADGRVAVTFYGTTSDGDPNSGNFKGAWDVYVSQSLDGGQSFGQVAATTHPFHYDSICLNGLGCDLAAPPGDRSLADFFAIGFNPVSGRLCVVFDRTNKVPDEALGHIAAPTVTCQIAGPSNGGGSVAVSDRAPLRDSTTDASGDALSNYSLTAAAIAPPTPPTTNDAAGDFTSAAIGPDPATDGFTVTLHVADLSDAALTQALTDTGGQSLQWIWRFTNGFQDVAASAAWSPAAGFTFGYDPYTTGSAPCDSASNAEEESEKCQVYPQAESIAGSVDQTAGTITLTVPGSKLHELGSADANGRPTQSAAAAGSRFYDGTAFSFANNASTAQAAQSFLYPLDNTPAFDFLLPAAAASGGGGTGSSGGSGGTPAAGGSASGGLSSGSVATAPAPVFGPVTIAPSTGGVSGATKTSRHVVSGRGYLRAVGRTHNAGFTLNAHAVTYTDNRIHLHFRSLRVDTVHFSGHTATLRGIGTLNGKRISFSAVASDGNPDRLTIKLGADAHRGTVVKGSIKVK